MKISMDKKYKTRDGQEVRIYAVDVEDAEYSVHGAIKYNDGWVPESWLDHGGYRVDVSCKYDLIEIKSEKEQLIELVNNGGFKILVLVNCNEVQLVEHYNAEDDEFCFESGFSQSWEDIKILTQKELDSMSYEKLIAEVKNA